MVRAVQILHSSDHFPIRRCQAVSRNKLLAPNLRLNPSYYIVTPIKWLPLQIFLSKLYLAPDNRPVRASNLFHREWGFTIYRTAYGPISDQRWYNLLETIQTKIQLHAIEQLQIHEDDPDFARLWSLFLLDAQSDKARLNGLSVDQVCDFYNCIDGSQPTNKTDSLRRIFLVADDEMLSDVSATIVKAVSADYIPFPYDRKPCSRGCRQQDFGWMKVTTGSVMCFWKELENQEFENIALPTIRRSDLVVWEGVDY